MKRAILAVLTAGLLFASTSCEVLRDGWLRLPGIHAPINFGMKYQLEENLYLIVVTGDKGGFEVKLEGEGENIKSIDGGYEITSSKTGLVYHVTADENGRLSVFIVSGDGKIQPYNPKSLE